MDHDAYRLIADLCEALGPRIDDAAALQDATGIPAFRIGRILRRDEDPRIDHAMALARACGHAFAPSCRQAGWSMPEPGKLRDRGAAALAEGDLAYLRDVFVSWRKATGLTPTGMARICGTHEKAFLRIERGDRLPLLGSATAHAAHFGLSIGLFPEGEVHALRAENEAARRKLGPSLRRAIEERNRAVEAPRPTAADALVAALTETADFNEIPARQIAVYAGLDARTVLGPARTFDPTGLFSTTAKVAAALDMEIVAVPAAVAGRIETEASAHECVPMRIAADAVGEVAAAMSQRISATVLLTAAEMARGGASSCEVAAMRALARRVPTLHTKHLAERLAEMDVTMMAVPSAAAPKARRIAEQSRVSPRRTRHGDAGEPTRERNHRLVSRFFRRLGERLPDGAAGLPLRRPRLQFVLDEMARSRLGLDIIDRETGERVMRYDGREASDLVGRIIDLRIARGYSLHAVGAGTNLTHAAVRRAERPEYRPHTLLSSLLRYAETIGLDLVPIRT